MPEKISTVAIVALVGGTVGGYITFSARTGYWMPALKAQRI